MNKTLLLSLITFIAIQLSTAQSVLVAGDIAFVGLNTDNGANKGFSFVLLTNIDAGTEIRFTDQGWTDSTGFIANSGDSIITWTTDQALDFGTVVNINSSSGANTGSTNTNVGLDLSRIGDQVFAFQGASDTTSNVISGIHSNIEGTTTADNWDGSVTNNRTSELPDGLTNGINALIMTDAGGAEIDNGIYNCTVTSGANAIRAAVNDITNWNTDNGSNFILDPFPCTFNAITTLTAGDLAFVGYNGDMGELVNEISFAFVLLTDIDAGTEIRFTDQGWTDGMGFVVNSGDEIITWTTNQALDFGTVVHISDFFGSDIGSTDTGRGLNLSRIGDQVFAFQGASDNTANVISGIHGNVEGTTTDTNWDGATSNNRTSALPDDLTTGVNAFILTTSTGSEVDNGMYNCSITSGVNAIRTAINNATNWNTDDSSNFDLTAFPCPFSVSGCPSVFSLTADNITTNSADLNWNASSEVTDGYVVEVFNAGDDPLVDTAVFTETIPDGTTTSMVTGLTEFNVYNAYVTSNCGATTGEAISIIFAAVICQPANFFEIAPATNALTDTTVTFEISVGSNDAGDRLVEVYNTGDDPTTTAPVSTTTGSFITGLTAGITYDAYLYADCGTDGLSSPLILTFTTISCFPISNLLASNATPTGFQLDWDADTLGTTVPPENYIIEVFENGADPMTATPAFAETVPASTTMSIVTGLEELTLYDTYVTSDCGATNGLSTSTTSTVETLIAQPSCGTGFFDPRGPDMDYDVNEVTTTTIMPDNPGEAVTITFTFVDIEVAVDEIGRQEGCFDWLTIYNGLDTSAPVLEMTLCGEPSGSGDVAFVASSRLDIGDSFTSTDASGALTIVFSSDANTPRAGWEATVSCNDPTLSVTDIEYAAVPKITPNPTSDFITITSDKSLDSYEIYNLLGQKVFENDNVNNQKATLNIDFLESGTYIMKIMTKQGEISTQKLIKN